MRLDLKTTTKHPQGCDLKTALRATHKQPLFGIVTFALSNDMSCDGTPPDMQGTEALLMYWNPTRGRHVARYGSQPATGPR